MSENVYRRSCIASCIWAISLYNFILLFTLRSRFSAHNHFHSRLLVELQDELGLMRDSVLFHQYFFFSLTDFHSISRVLAVLER